jgi:hypothetical protein
VTGSTKLRYLGLVVLAFAFFTVTVTGCGGSKVTKENAAKIKNEMTEAQVKEHLGDPTESKEAGEGALKGKISTWKNGNDTVVVTFVDGKAAIIVSSFEKAK